MAVWRVGGGRWIAIAPAIATALALALIGAGGSTAAKATPTCFGKEPTYIGTNGRDRVVDHNGDPGLGRNPVIVLLGGRDLVDLSGNSAAIATLTICSGGGKDRVEIFEGTAERTSIRGGGGNDRLGNSSPHLDFSFVENLTVVGGGGDDVLLGGSLTDKLAGGGGNDRIEAGNFPDRVSGGGGDDKLFGEGHGDRLKGGPGDDKLIGDSRFYQPGEDRANGGPGSDRCKAEIKRGCER